ncbi:tyrosyl-DNA phosphodiesterase-domain-containing protein [Mycena albidolilacea]|uniref:Tyrosyl-DNA phosphodiesterase-domain-containing protein n=1 Tax=Mycena albidolilacea TaxID=1033008 RepID=A0AAD7A593_9AGAR|nr:tyrosyl-DNA phosphodiesterase-domain-containing protein [Mycena albidolilacea]
MRNYLRECKDTMKISAENATRPKLSMKYADGALRITRTPGRQNTRNTVSLDDLIEPKYLSAAMIYSYFIEPGYLFERFLPLKTGYHLYRPHVPIYIGRDLSMDGVGQEFGGFTTTKPTTADFENAVECAQAGYREMYGDNFHPFYPKMTGGGCAHSKFMILVYPDFLRVAITSANLMKLDVVRGDNMWYIQDFPRRAKDDESEQARTGRAFQADLRKHVEELACPTAFTKAHLDGAFDFSAAKVYLVTSKPGTFSKDRASDYGQLKLRDIVRRKIFKKFSKANPPPKLSFEICVGSVGHLQTQDVVKNFLESCTGNLQKSIEGKPKLKMIFPTVDDVENSTLGRAGANNISCHMDWRKLEEKNAEYLKDVFYHYYSKDRGCLFHTKSILALHADAPKATPLYMYLGSANFSTNAWGAVKPEKRLGVQATGITERLEGIGNFECGVVIKGWHIAGMLETGKWEDIVPYERPTEAMRYKDGEWPWKLTYADMQGTAGGPSAPDADEMPCSVMDLVRVLSKKKVLHLRGEA